MLLKSKVLTCKDIILFPQQLIHSYYYSAAMLLLMEKVSFDNDNKNKDYSLYPAMVAWR